MENDAKLATENQKIPNREIYRSDRSFSTTFKHHVNKNIYESKQPSGQSISYLAEKESYQQQSKQKATLNSKCNCRVSCTFKQPHMCFQRFVSRLMSFFFPFTQLSTISVMKMKNVSLKTIFCLHFLNCTLSSENESPLSFFIFSEIHFYKISSLSKYRNNQKEKKKGCREITIQQPFFFKELTRCSKVQ